MIKFIVLVITAAKFASVSKVIVASFCFMTLLLLFPSQLPNQEIMIYDFQNTNIDIDNIETTLRTLLCKEKSEYNAFN